MNKQKTYRSTGTKSRTRIPKSFWVVAGIILVSSLPYLSDVLTVRTDGGTQWSPLLGLHLLMPDPETPILGFSGFRMFLYTLFIFVFTTLGWSTWLIVAKDRPYRKALYAPVVLGIYQILMILTGLRTTTANSWEVKTGLIIVLAIVLGLSRFKEGSFRFGLTVKWLLIIGATTLPFFHDIITLRETAALKDWVPDIGIGNALTDMTGNVGGFGSYRAFVYFFMLHLYAHLGWLGSFIYYDYHIKKIRPFLLVPVIISLFSLILFILNIQDTPFGAPDIKFYITIGLSGLLAWNFFFNDRTGRTLNAR
jgi:hypothetical protein